jgi:hypothetical protein
VLFRMAFFMSSRSLVAQSEDIVGFKTFVGERCGGGRYGRVEVIHGQQCDCWRVRCVS